MVHFMNEFIERFQMQRFLKCYTNDSGWQPPTDMFDMGDFVLIKMELPGIKSSDVTIELQGSQLTIKGCRNESKCKKMRVIQMEIMYGCFEKQLTLPYLVDPQKASIVYYNGLFEIKLPKALQQQTTHAVVLLTR
jgi:HSP20 family protein